MQFNGCARNVIIFFSFVSCAAYADERSRWSLSVEVPFTGPQVEYEFLPGHRAAISGYSLGGSGTARSVFYGGRYILLLGSGEFHGELGIGVLYERRRVQDVNGNFRRDEDEPVGMLSYGMRYEPMEGGIQLRGGLAWHPGTGSVLDFVPLPYVSVGWGF